MIASLTGVVQGKSLDHVVVDVGGVGYHVLLSTQTLAEVPAQGDRVSLLCHTHVREEALQLFGFASEQERKAFGALIGVSGVGPRLALTILSGMAVEDLVRAIADGNHRRLQGIPGIGKKTAERLVLELRDRFARLAASSGPSAGDVDAGSEVVEALVNLGYKRAIAEHAVKRVVEGKGGEGAPPPAEKLLRESLAVISEA